MVINNNNGSRRIARETNKINKTSKEVEGKDAVAHKRKPVRYLIHPAAFSAHFSNDFRLNVLSNKIMFAFKFAGKREPPKSKEQLDAELDQYMVNTKSSLDQEMSAYMK